MNKLFVRLLQARGLKPSFLNPKYEELTDPFTLPGMSEAIARIEKAIKDQEKILRTSEMGCNAHTGEIVRRWNHAALLVLGA